METNSTAFVPGSSHIEKSEYVATNIKLSFKQRFDYAVSEFGYNSIYYWVSAFMMIYYTDTIGVAAAAVSALTLWVRVFDAVNDPLIGSIADRSNSRWGKYKPWVAIGGTVLGILIVLLFSANPGWGYGAKIAYMWTIYVLVTVASTCCNMPFGALNGVLTSDGGERAKLSGLRMVFANLGTNFNTLIAVPLVIFFSAAGGTRTARGYTLAVLTCVVMGVPLLIYSAVKVKEVVKPPKTQTTIPIKAQFAAFFKNRYSIIAALGFFMIGFQAYGRGAMQVYYFTYVAGNAALTSYVGLTGIFAAFMGAGFLSARLYRKLLHKGRCVQVFYGCSALFYLALYFVDSGSPLFWICLTLANTGHSAGIATSYGLIGDSTDFGEYKSGVRVDGFVASFVSLMMKAGGAVGPAILLAVIGTLGYTPNVGQNATVLNMLSASISIVPAACCALIVVFYMFYNMDSKKHEEIRVELERRRMG